MKLEREFVPGVVPSTTVTTPLDMEKKTRENILNELIDTEAEYIKDMKMMIKALLFHHPQSTRCKRCRLAAGLSIAHSLFLPLSRSYMKLELLSVSL